MSTRKIVAWVEGTVEHIHVHLDVLVDGQAEQVPANIGIGWPRRSISPGSTFRRGIPLGGMVQTE
jgi:hypothetical protein